MTSEQKRTFVEDLLNAVRQSILADIEKMPEGWDGHELRQIIADRFDAQKSLTTPRDRSRLRDYRNEVLVRGL